MSRPKKPEGEKLKPVTVYLLPKVFDRVTEMAKGDRRSLSATATFMIEHALTCHVYKGGHVPVDQIKFLRGQGK